MGLANNTTETDAIVGRLLMDTDSPISLTDLSKHLVSRRLKIHEIYVLPTARMLMSAFLVDGGKDHMTVLQESIDLYQVMTVDRNFDLARFEDDVIVVGSYANPHAKMETHLLYFDNNPDQCKLVKRKWGGAKGAVEDAVAFESMLSQIHPGTMKLKPHDNLDLEFKYTVEEEDDTVSTG